MFMSRYEEDTKQMLLGSTGHNIFCWFLRTWHENLKRLGQFLKVSIHVHVRNNKQQEPVSMFEYSLK